MYPLYKDIRGRCGAPDWHDEHGVPRYGEFDPDNLGISDAWALEMRVTCQSCGMTFKCCTGAPRYAIVGAPPNASVVVFDEKTILDNLLGWGDAPWHTEDGDQASFGGQCAGTTMTADCEPVRLWYEDNFKWRIVAEWTGDGQMRKPTQEASRG
jgi:hypothetical protein